MIKFALVGCGRISTRHAEVLVGELSNEVILASACDLDKAKASSFGEKYGIPYFFDMHEMASAINPDVFVILTESGNHCSNVLDLVKYKKHFIVEKPLSLSLNDADRMIEACDKAGVKLFVVKQNRFNKPIIELKRAVDSGRFGKLALGTVRVRWCRDQTYYDQAPWRGTWAMDGGVLTNQAIHHVDMLQWIMGPVQSVFGYSATQLVDIEAEDTAVVSIRFMNGSLGIIEATTAARPRDQEGSISILGEKGLVEVGGFAMNKIKTWQFLPVAPEDESIAECSSNPPNVYGYGHHLYYQHVISNLHSRSSNLIDGIEGRKSLEIVNAIYESVETSRPIDLRYVQKSSKLGQ